MLKYGVNLQKMLYFLSLFQKISAHKRFIGNKYVTVPDKRDHFQQYFKIELLVLKGRVEPTICGILFVLKVTRCGDLAISVQSFLTTIVRPMIMTYMFLLHRPHSYLLPHHFCHYMMSCHYLPW